MFESKSPAVKIGAYIIIGFLTLLIAATFAMPDYISKLGFGMNENVVAIVNGKQIYRIDFLRYRDTMLQRMPNAEKQEMLDMILNNMIIRRLLLQKADKTGIQVSDDRVMKSIKNFFKDQDGKFSKIYMDRYLVHYHMGFSDFFSMIKEDLIINEFRHLMSLGEGVSPDEVKTDFSVENSKIQIKYCYISGSDLNKRYNDSINISEKEIDEQLQKSKNEIKDPATDRKRIKDKLEKNKLNALKNELIGKIDKLAEGNKSFKEASSVLGGIVYTSNIFKIGDPIREGSDKGKIIHSISNSEIFINGYLTMEYGKTSRVIDSFDGLYIFTPIKKEFTLKEPGTNDYAKIEYNLLDEKNNALFMSELSSLREKAKIIRNLKFN